MVHQQEDDEDNEEQVLSNLTDALKAKGIFIVRCAAHSFQLVLKDVAGNVDFVAQTRKFLCGP